MARAKERRVERQGVVENELSAAESSSLASVNVVAIVWSRSCTRTAEEPPAASSPLIAALRAK